MCSVAYLGLEFKGCKEAHSESAVARASVRCTVQAHHLGRKDWDADWVDSNAWDGCWVRGVSINAVSCSNLLTTLSSRQSSEVVEEGACMMDHTRAWPYGRTPLRAGSNGV